MITAVGVPLRCRHDYPSWQPQELRIDSSLYQGYTVNISVSTVPPCRNRLQRWKRWSVCNICRFASWSLDLAVDSKISSAVGLPLRHEHFWLFPVLRIQSPVYRGLKTVPPRSGNPAKTREVCDGRKIRMEEVEKIRLEVHGERCVENLFLPGFVELE